MEKKNLNIETVEIQSKKYICRIYFFKITDWSKDICKLNDLIKADAPIQADILIKNQTCVNDNFYELLRRFSYYYRGIVFNTSYVKAYSGNESLQSIMGNTEEWCYVYITRVDLFIKEENQS